MSKKLAIRGHSTRGKEVIKLLEMIGGSNIYQHDGEANAYSYYISGNVILHDRLSIAEDDDFEIFTLEEFLEKYPFKAGDKVYIKVDPNMNCLGSDKIYSVIESALWVEKFGYLIYRLEGFSRIFNKDELYLYEEEVDMEAIGYYTSNELKLHKEINMNIEYDLTKYSYEVKDGKLVISEKKPKYPTTYEECCEVIGINRHDVEIDLPQPYQQKMFNLFKLYICREAYWKIYGEEMGLSKPWKPDWDNLSTNHEFIEIDKGCFTYSSRVLVFPTAFLRTEFYWNFKDLIEQCKELL